MTIESGNVAASIEGISLADLDAIAALQTRTDRKYIVERDVISELVDTFADEIKVLDIDGRRTSAYQSIYFDTVDLALYHAAARGRRRRFKVRTRLYPDAPSAVLEVKQKTSRGETVKQRFHSRVVDERELSPDDRSFIDAVVEQPGASADLVPRLTTRYRRTTLVNPASQTRLTYDQELSCTDWLGQTTTLPAVIIETKTPGGASPFDRWLWRSGIRPEKVSKFCVGLAVLHPELPSNKWHRTIKRHFSLAPTSPKMSNR